MGYAKWLVLSVLVAVLAACGQLGQPEKAAQPGDDGLTVQDTVVLGDGVVANNALNLGQIQQGSYAEGNVVVKIVCQGGSSNRAQEGAMGFTGSSHSEVSLQGSDLTISHNWATLDKCNDQGATPNPTGTVTIRATAAANATLGERSVSFTVTSTDAKLPLGQRSITFTVKYEVVAATPTDTAPPTVTVSFLPEDGDNGWFKTSPVIGSVSASDDASVSEITCSGAALSSVTGIGSTLASGTLTVTQQGTSNVTCTAKDGLDNSGAATGSSNTATVKLDSVAPTVTPADVSDTTWRNTSLSQTFTAFDATSGLADNDDAEFRLTVFDESTNASTPTTASHTVKDNAGNETTRTLSALIDSTAPTITLDSISPAANDDGWNNSDVTVTWSCADALSGIESNTVSQTVTGEGDDLSTTGTCADNAGNTASDTQTVKIDRTDPTITAAADREPNANGWYSASVTVSFTCGDTLSGVASCPEPVTVDGDTPAEGQDVSRTATDVAGNSASSNTVNVKLDTTAPTITATAKVNGQPYDGNWTNQTVTVSFTCSDALSGLDGSCPADVVISSDTPAAGQDVSASVSDLAGNSATSDIITVKVDTTAPTASASRSPAANEHGWNNSAVTVSFSGSDELSGIASCSTDVVLSGEGADQSASGTCTDNAGNVSDSASVTGINIDLTAPVVTVTGTGGYSAGSWTNQDVTVTFACDASISGIASQTESVTVSTEGENQSAPSTCTDKAGNSTTATFTGINIDKTAPTITASISPEAVNGWYNIATGAPTVSFTCSDSGSGLAGSCPEAVILSEGASQSVSKTVTDNAGNSATANINDINVDLTAPMITFQSRTEANTAGWNNTDVTATWACADATSGPVTPSVQETLSSEGADQSLTGTCTDMAGNSASDTQIGINIDKTKPTASASRDIGPNANGWNNSDVKVSFSGTDGLSGIDSCTASQTFGEGAGQSATGTCTDVAGNVSVPVTENNINVDKTAPTASASASPAPNANGWNKSDVTVSFTGTDSLSGIDTCEPAVTLSGEGTNLSASGTCADKAGNVSDSATASGINIDKTAPTDVTFIGGPDDGGTYYFDFVPAAPSCTANGNISGLESCEVSGYGVGVGSHTMTATATDKAGNTAMASRSYTVAAWTLNGFYKPVSMDGVYNKVKGGSTVPLKFEVFAGTTELTSTSAVKSFTTFRIACDSGQGEDEVDFVTTGGTSLRYDTKDGQFIQNWQTPRQAGACYRVTMTTQDGSSLVALFKLK